MDTTETRFNNLMFLLSVAPLATGCVIVTDDTETTDPTGAGTASTDTETPTTTDMPTSDGTTGGTASMDGSDSGPADTTDSGPADTTDSGPDTETGEGPQSCIDYAATIADCYTDDDGQMAYEQCVELYADYEAYGAECLAAWEDYLACLSGSSCEELMMDGNCSKNFDTVEATCVK